jgi:hypothetical protein
MVLPGGSEIGPFETSADQWAVGRLHGAAAGGDVSGGKRNCGESPFRHEPTLCRFRSSVLLFGSRAKLRRVSDEQPLDPSVRAARERPPEERFANAPFPLYGLPPDWNGGRFLGDVSWGGERPGPDETTALTLAHGTIVEGLAAIRSCTPSCWWRRRSYVTRDQRHPSDLG